MTFIHDDGTERGSAPTEGTLADGRTVSGIQPDDLTLLAACGWYPVTDTPRPDDTDTDTYERSIVNEAGTWTVEWTARPWTAAEIAARTRAPSADERLEVLLAALAKVTTVAQVRAAAQAAAA